MFSEITNLSIPASGNIVVKTEVWLRCGSKFEGSVVECVSGFMRFAALVLTIRGSFVDWTLYFAVLVKNDSWCCVLVRVKSTIWALVAMTSRTLRVVSNLDASVVVSGVDEDCKDSVTGPNRKVQRKETDIESKIQKESVLKQNKHVVIWVTFHYVCIVLYWMYLTVILLCM